MIAAKINVNLIDKAKLFPGQKGKYLDIILLENRDGEDQYGNAGMVVQDTSKEERVADKRGAILGNYKIIGRKEPAQPPARREATPTMRAPKPVDPDLDAPEVEDLPF